MRASRFFLEERPEFVFLAAAKVGGILANNTYPGEFISENLAIQTNVIEAAYKSGVKRLLFLGSSCIYPRDRPQPIREEYMLTSTARSNQRTVPTRSPRLPGLRCAAPSTANTRRSTSLPCL